MPLRDRSGQRWQPPGRPCVVAATEASQGSLEPVPFLGAHTQYTCKRGEVFLGVSNEVRLRRFSSPPFGSLFILFPFYTLLVSSFLSCPPVFMSGHLILFFVCAHIGPGLSVYVQLYIHLKHRFQVAQVFTMRWGSSVVPVHLVSLSLQPHTFFVPFCPPSHVFILLSLPRAHLHNRPSLNSFCLPSGRRVCVCVSPLES